MFSPWLHRSAIALAVLSLLSLIEGATIVSRQAQMGPGHSMAGSLVGVVTLVVVAMLARQPGPAWRKKFGFLLLAGAALEGALGIISAKSQLPPGFNVLHACLAHLFFAGTVALVVFTSAAWQTGPELVPDQGWPSLRSLAIAAPVLVFLQVSLGAAFRFQMMGIMMHFVGALIVAIVVLLVGAFVLHQFPEHRALRPVAKIVMGVTFGQVLLGIGALLARMMDTDVTPTVVIATVAHVTTGALTLAANIVLAIQIRRNVFKPVEVDEE